LRHQRDIVRVRQQGQAKRHPLAVLLVSPNGIVESRFGFSASRHIGNAVARNRARRLLREVVRQQLPTIQPGWDCLLIARQQTPTASYQEVEAALLELFSRARLLSKTPSDVKG